MEDTNEHNWSLKRLLDDKDLFRQRDLLWPSSFVRECQNHGLGINEDTLEYYDKVGLLKPILSLPRIKQWYVSRVDGNIEEVPEGTKITPQMTYRLASYNTDGGNLLALREEAFIIDPQFIKFKPWNQDRDPLTREKTISRYYSLYQMLHVHYLFNKITVYSRVHYAKNNKTKPVKRIYGRFNDNIEWYKKQTEELNHIVLFLLAIQNRYLPVITNIFVNYPNIADWLVYREHFSPREILQILPLSIAEVRKWRSDLCYKGKKIDPLIDWYELVGYIDWDKREKLQGFAKLSQQYYLMVNLLDHFLRDLAKENGQEEPEYTCLGSPSYEKQVYHRRHDFLDQHVLDHVLTDYGINPRPKVVLVVEGDTEEKTIPLITEAMDINLASYGIKIHNIRGVDKDLSVLLMYAADPPFQPPLKPGVYAAARQTRIFVLLDREGKKWREDKKAEQTLSTMRSQLRSSLPDDLPNHVKDAYVNEGIVVERWDKCFELDNFSNLEIAEAISSYARTRGWPDVTDEDVEYIRRMFPRKRLNDIIADKILKSANSTPDNFDKKEYQWDKVIVGMQLVNRLIERIKHETDETLVKAPIIDRILVAVQMARSNWP